MRNMKDSGIEWIGQIPEDWGLSKIGAIYEERNIKVSDQNYPPLSVTKQGVVPQLETAAKTDNGDNRKLIKKNDFVINSRSDRRGSCGISEYDGSCSLINTVLKPRHNMHNRYYNCVFRSELFADEFYRWGNGIVDDLWSTKWSNMKRIYVPFPNIEIQRRIADFLDEKCGKIDRYIAKQQQVIEKLKTYKQSVITEAVAYRNGWTSCHLGYLAQFKNGLNYSGLSTDVEIKFLGVGDFQAHFILDSKEMFSTLKFDGNMPEDLLLKSGDIVFVRSNGSKELVGRSVLIENIDYPLTYSGFCIRMRNYRQDAVLSKFLLYRFWSNEFRQSLNRDSRGSNINNLNQELLSKLTVSFPNIKEQRDIIDFLDKKCAEIDRTIDKKQLLIDKLTEYKKSLIYEAVTGKLEV